jgi:hypothetical protein
MDVKSLGISMIVPTLFLAFYITYTCRKVISELYHNLAVCLWITANSTWMIGEFFYDDTLRPYATVFFLGGLGILAFYYIFLYKRLKESEITGINNIEDKSLRSEV